MELLDRLSITALAAINGIGTRTISRLSSTLIKHQLGWEEFWVLNADSLTKLFLSENQINSIKIFKKEHTIYSYQELLIKNNIRSVVVGDTDYPALLSQCRYGPIVLFAKGPAVAWSEHVIAVVGTRQMTAYGKLATQKIVTELVALNSIVVSGFMYGVDVCAHLSCLAAGGTTVGVLAYGFDYCYPSAQRKLQEDLLGRGMTFITPFAPHIAPQKGYFPARNRVVAGMSHAVVVTEAAEKSGSHITANYALDEGRVVCAVPGPITNPYCEGTRSLINQGAAVVSSGYQVLQECGVLVNTTSMPECAGTFVDQNQSLVSRVLSFLHQGSLTTEEVSHQLNLEYPKTLLELTLLELSGKISKQNQRWYLNFQAK
jgi:DNA processing protein